MILVLAEAVKSLKNVVGEMVNMISGNSVTVEKRLIILGSGGYGHTVADVAEQLGYKILLLDDSLPDHPLSLFVEQMLPKAFS